MLKKWSSFSVWEEYSERFDRFVAEYEKAVLTWPAGEAPPETNLKAAYQAQSLYKLALIESGHGNRSVLRSDNGGHLRLAAGLFWVVKWTF